MIKNLTPLPFILLLVFLSSFNQVAAIDDPCTAGTLSVGTSFSALTVTNSGATNSSIAVATCDGNSDGDIWYSALAGQNGTLIIETRPGTLSDIGMALYTGANCSSLSFNSCTAGGTPGFSNMPYKSLSGLTPGSRIWIRLWDVNNDQTGTFEISAYVNCNASVSITGPSSACNSSSTQLCATAGFNSYSWTGGLGSTCINVNSTGTYVVTVTDDDGCTATSSHSFTSLAAPSVTITGPSSACSTDSPQLCVPTGYSDYNWSNSGTNRCINPTSTGVYSVTVTAGNGCTGSDTHLISVYSSPVISITGPPSKCSGSSDQLCAPSGYNSYSWTGGATTNCINPANSGTYTVTVSDVHGCMGSASHAITVNPTPSVSITGPANACPGSGPQFCAASGFSTYDWSNGGTANCISPATSGTYTLTVTDGFGCTATASKALNYYTPVSVSITGPSSSCAGTSAQLCATSGFSSYDWSTGSSATCINPSATGNYTVIVTDANNCTGSASQSFTLNPLPSSAISGPASVCNGASAQLCAPAGHASYLWSGGETTSCISTSASGNYTVTVTGSNGCTNSSSHNLTIFPNFAMSVTGPSTACSGSSPQLCATSGSYTYQWSNGSTSACISPSVSGTYTVIATSVNGCTRSASKGLTVYSALNASISGPSSACTGTVIQLCASAGNNTTYAWSNGATTQCINVNSNGSYSVIITDINGCSASATKNVNFSSSFNIDITGPTSGCNGNSATLCVPSGYVSYAWSTGETTDCINVTTPGNYSVTVHDMVGCVANDFYNLNFSPPPTVSIFGPTIICTGALATWCATPGFSSYLWSNGGISDCVNISSDTVYSVTITDLNGCTASSSAPLTVVEIQPGIYELGGLLYCDTVNPSYIYEWLLNGQPTGCMSETCAPTFSGLYSVIVTDTVSGCTETGTYNFVSTGIIRNFDNNSEILLFPNPFAGNSFQIDFRNMKSEKTQVDVYDALGRHVFGDEFLIDDDHFLHTINLPSRLPGIYYVNIRSREGVILRRIIGS